MLDTELDTLPRLIADAAEPLPDIDDERFGSLLRPLRRCARRLPRRGEPRDERILPRPRRDLAPADRARMGSTSSRSKAIGPIARRSTAMSAIAAGATASSRRSSASRCGCGGMRRSTRSFAGCGSTTGTAPMSGCAVSTGSTSTTSAARCGRSSTSSSRKTPSSRSSRTGDTAALTRGPRTRRSTAGTRCWRAMPAARSG